MPTRQELEPDGSGISQRQFYDAMQVLRDLIDERHRVMRETMETRFDKVFTKMDAHALDDQLIQRNLADRVLTIENEREAEAKQVIRRSTWVAMLAGSVVPLAWKAIAGFFLPTPPKLP